jgi:hypothetical protein
MDFEHMRAEPHGFRVHLLSCSDPVFMLALLPASPSEEEPSTSVLLQNEILGSTDLPVTATSGCLCMWIADA